LPDAALPRKDSFFQFRRMNFRKNIHLSHFQLRHLFASVSRSRVFYPAVGSVQQFNPMTGHGRAIMRIGDSPVSQISTLAAGHGVLVAGSFHGDYTLRNLNLNEPTGAAHEGVITSSSSGITNHVAVHQSRTSSSPLAAFASNDDCFRVLDIATETWLSREKLDFAPNCTAVSPDGRLRVVVGDSRDVIITAADPQNGAGKPDILQKLSGHRDYGFACDWADDGWTIATGFQDKTVKVWDARRFTDASGNAQSVCTLRSEMAGVRTLRFSPIGSGKRVLVAAEEADFINIIDAQTYRSKQTLDIFGELGGVSFANAGQDLMVMCCDRARGGILQLERCGEGKEFMRSQDGEGYGHEDHQRRNQNTYDWPRSVFTDERRIKRGSYSRRRGLAAQVELEPF
jgi:WD40 repeat protein